MKDIDKAIFEAVKNDDAKAFSDCVLKNKGAVSLCFGRFPLLSLCYLYKSRKIVKQFEQRLTAVSSYTYTDEPYEIYKKFKTVAKRCLRFYLGDTVVSPAEMLAFLNESGYLKEVYSKFKKDAGIDERIEKIYGMNHSGRARIEGDKISLPKSPLKKLQKVCLAVIVAVAVLMSALPLPLWAYAKNSFGLGTGLISNEKQLQTAIRQNQNFVLKNDIYIDGDWQGGDFSGTMDGAGYKVHINSQPAGGFINKLTGTIENCAFLFKGLTSEFTEDKALIVQINNGTIKSVKLTYEGNIRIKVPLNKSVLVSAFVYENNGEVLSCTADIRASLYGNGGNAFFASLAAKNNGIIKGCSASVLSAIKADTVDAAGLIIQNFNGAVVQECINYASLTQTASNEEWSPNIAGITLFNYGKIASCANYGTMTAESNKDSTTQAAPNVYAGGITCFNYNLIEKCKNDAGISAKAGSGSAYTGGITAINGALNITLTATILNCCSYGGIGASAENSESFVFAGGIAGCNVAGIIKDCYSACSYNAKNERELAGGIAGAAYREENYVYFDHINNYYVVRDNIKYGTASYILLAGESAYIYEGDEQGCVRLAAAEQLIGLDIYWG